MDEDLKIVLTSELEADEQASARRISAQLPNIARLINSKSNIKVGVSLDEANIQSQAQKITQQVSNAVKTHGIGVSLSLDGESVSKFRAELDSLKVSPDISRAMTDQLDKMGIQIDRITGHWESAKNSEERMLNLSIQGTDQMHRTVTYMQTYNAETGEIETRLTNVTANLEQQRRTQESLAAQARRDNESRVSYLNRQLSLLADIQATYAGATSVKPVMDAAHLDSLNGAYAAINQQIQDMIGTEGRLDAVQRSNLEGQISGLQRLVKEYQNAEYVATKLRAKDITSVKDVQLSQIEALENRLKSAGTLTEEFQGKINGLKASLQNVGTKDQLVAFLNEFDQLNNDVSVFQERLRGANKLLSELAAVEKKMASVHAQMIQEKGAGKLSALEGRYNNLAMQKQALEEQLAYYSGIIQYANNAKVLEQGRLDNISRLNYAQMEMTDKAREYDAAMRSVPATISDLETRFKQVVEPTTTLTQNMRMLRDVAFQYSSNMSDKQKVETYERLSKLIGDCRKETAELLRVQRGDVVDFKFSQDLEKAKADLATVGRTWSALKNDPGLNAQFQQLSANLKRVDNQMDLKKWTAQFSAFKSEVKAAGKNMQSLGDVLKNNVGKVLQWVSATTLLFRAFRLLKTAVSTVVDLDTAMIDLQKVTNATHQEYERFYLSANNTAKALGITTKEIISQTAEWARLGYSMSEAAELAKNSAIFEAISPDMDISRATDGLVSIIKAYDLDVEDSLDGIISKVNEVGNKFAVSNGDIVEALTRSSAAMASANNTFEETVALATSAIEITRDAASVGNGLKTLSMRIRGYDEETEEYSKDIAILTGEIADLTKVASNNYAGVSLFEAGDPDTYRSTYDILADIADIWDELADKKRANLLEALFGKRQAQIGAAILSNFDQAEKAIKDMENSAGGAGREMAKIEQSLEYKLNALKETWVGVAQSLFKTDDMKIIVDFLTSVSESVAGLTDALGLFGTLGVAGALILVHKFRAEMALLGSTVTPVVASIKSSGVAMNGSASSVQFYAMKLMGLDKAQQAAAMSALGLNREHRKQITDMVALIASAQKYTIQELAEKAATDKAAASALAKSMVKATEKKATDQLTSSMIVEILSSKKLTAAQKEAIITSLQQSAANQQQAFSWKLVATNAKAALAAMATNPMMWITLASTVVMGIAAAWRKVKESAEEARQAMTDAANAAVDNTTTLAELIKQYRELASAGDFDQSSRETAKDIQEQITDLVGQQADNLDLVNGKLDDQISKLDEIAYQSAKDAKNALETKYLDAQNQYNSGIDAVGTGTNFVGVVKNQGTLEEILRMIGDIPEEWLNVNGGVSLGVAFDGKNAEEVLEVYKELQDILLKNDDWKDYGDSLIGMDSQDILNGIQQQIDVYGGIVDELNTATDNYLRNQATIDIYDSLKTTTIDSKEALSDFIGQIQSNSEYSEEYKQILIDTAKNTFPDFTEAVSEAEDGVSTYSAQLQKLPDIISGMKSAYDVLATAENEMANGGGLSPETIESLASAEKNYLDYLYEENGVIKLNTDAWKENANEKMLGDIDEIQREIDSLKECNAVLEETIKTQKEQQMSAPSAERGEWEEKIRSSTAALEENNKQIEENQGKLAIYSSLYGTITGDLDAYTQALHNFADVSSTIDTISGSFQTLADLQSEVAGGFTMSLDKALEFAKVYPEIMNGAQATADGQIALNEAVVNSFIQGKKAELDAQIDSEITKLQADKSVLDAKLASAKAQLELAKNVGEGEGQISKETAEYRINVGNALTSSLIDMGIDEATAYSLAAAAMAENQEEFAEVAKGAFENMDDNAAKAAYNMAHAIFINADKSCKSISDIAKQAHQTAKAISAMGDGNVAGSTLSQFRGSDGTQTSGLSLDLYHGEFKGTDYDYEAKTASLDDYVSQLELDISAYNDAIKQIDGQIAALQALKNIPLKQFQSQGANGGKGAAGAKKDVEEYTAAIDKYREAVEALRKAQEQTGNIEKQVESADTFEEKIALEKQLIEAYKGEQIALHNLNDARRVTIAEGVESLRALGFAVEYNADTNELWIDNMEHLNDLTADSKGKYDTLQEATNELRKGTEDLIGTITDLNDSNREGSEAWRDLGRGIQEAKQQIIDFLANIVNSAHDAVDEIQGVYDALHQAADEFAANDGFITVDTYQDLLKLGPQYMQMLRDENGLWKINEERINAVIAAKTQQLAVDNAMSYVERIRLATRAGAIESLDNLIFANNGATSSTWGLVYAELELMHVMGDLTDSQYNAALHNIQAMQDLAANAIDNIGRSTGAVAENMEKTRNQLEETKKVLEETLDGLEDMQDGAGDLVEYVMGMLKHRIQQQIDLLGKMKETYSNIIDLKKESLDASKEEQDYQKEISKKLKDMAKIQERLNALSLDDSRAAQAERAGLLDELAALQEDLSETQANKAIESQKESLDKMEEDYHAEKDREIEVLEQSISSTQKLYDMAIDYIRKNWDTLYSELITWNTEYGSDLNSEITTAWEAAQAAAQRYGDFVSAIMGGISSDIESITKQIEALDSQMSNLGSGSSGGSIGGVSGNDTVSNKGQYETPSNEESIHSIIKEMYANSQRHGFEDTAGKTYLNKRNLVLGAQLAQYGVTAVRGNDGTWYVDRVGGQLLYDRYRKYIYHTGGFVGDEPLKPNEKYVKAEDGELMLTSEQQDSLASQIDRISAMAEAFGGGALHPTTLPIRGTLAGVDQGTINNITNNSRPIKVTIGDTIIQGNPNSDTVRQHMKITRDMMNQIGNLIRRG